MRKQDSGRLIGLAILLVSAIAIPQIPHVEGTAGLALDGSGFGSATDGGCSWSTTLRTTRSPDVVVALLVVNDTTTNVNGVTDTAGLFWTLRAKQAGPSNVQVFFYYAIASVLLSADSITFGLSSTAVGTICEEFGVSGANTSVPFDVNSAMPSTNGGTSTTNSVTYNTNNPNDFLIIFQGFCAQGSAGSGSPSGFTTIVGSGNAHISPSNCPSDFLQSNTYYKIVSAAQSSNTVSWPFDNLSSQFAIIGDAIQSAPGPLSASATAGSNVVDVGQSASFSCTGAGGVSPYTYSWTFGDGSTGSGASTSHIYNTLGTMTVSCIVTDSLGTTANSALLLTVNRRATLTALACSSRVVVNQGSTCKVTVTDTSFGTFTTPTGIVGLSQSGLQGSFATCTLAGTIANATCSSTFTASTIGTATITASYLGDSTHTSSSDTTSITVNSALSITSFTASPTSLDSGEKIVLAVSTSGGGGALSYSYENLPGGCLSTNATTVSCTPSSSGNFVVKVTVTDQAGESVTATVSVNVGPQRVLGLPQALGLTIVFGGMAGIGAIVIVSIALALRRKKRRQAPTVS